jgi:hypothetical protein
VVLCGKNQCQRFRKPDENRISTTVSIFIKGIDPLVDLVKLAQNSGMKDGGVVELLKIANGYLPRVRLEYDRVKEEKSSLEAELNSWKAELSNTGQCGHSVDDLLWIQSSGLQPQSTHVIFIWVRYIGLLIALMPELQRHPSS